MSKKHFTYFQQFGGGAIEDIDSAIAKLNGIITSLKTVNQGKPVTPTSIVVPARIASELTEEQRNLVNWDDKVGGNILHHINSPQALELLLLSVPQLKGKINEKNSNGKTPLDIALLNNESDIANILQINGAVEGNIDDPEIWENYGAKSESSHGSTENDPYKRRTVLPEGAPDVYSVGSAGHIGSTGPSISSVKIPSSGSSLRSLPSSTGSSQSSIRKSSTESSQSSTESTSENSIDNIIKRSSMWIFLTVLFGPGLITCNYLDYYQNTDTSFDVLTKYYFRWTEQTNKLDAPSYLDSMMKDCQKHENYTQNFLFPLIIYKSNGEITYGYIQYNFSRSELRLIGIFIKNPITYTNFGDQIIKILNPYTGKTLYYQSPETQKIKIFEVTGIDYSINVNNSLIKTVSKKINETYTNEYAINLLYLISIAGFTKGHMTVEKFNNMLLTGFLDDLNIDDINIDNISLKSPLNEFIDGLNNLRELKIKDMSQKDKLLIASVTWSNALE